MRITTLFIFLLLFAACGGNADQSGGEATNGAATEGGLTQSQLENGIGPVESVDLGAIDEALAAQGEEIFRTKCSACHKMDERYVGPPMEDIVENRTPAYIMNMMLNPEEMLQKHPEARAMLGEYMTPMPNQQLTEDDARGVLEYLRSTTGAFTGE
ncbi:MAG: cytochrome c [Rhodothermales bacterium]